MKEQVFRFKATSRSTVITYIVILGFWFFWAIAMSSGWMALIFGLLLFFFVLDLVRSFYDRITITDTEIIVTHYFRTKEIVWNDISDVKPGWTGFLLSNASGDVQVFISGGTMDLWKFLKMVNKRRPDVLRPSRSVFHENPAAALLFGGIGFFIAYIVTVEIITNPADLVQKVVALIFGISFVLLALFLPTWFSFAEDKLIVKTLLRERAVHLRGLDFDMGRHTSLFLISKDGYRVSMDNLLEGKPSFLLTFQCWLNSRSGKFHETLE